MILLDTNVLSEALKPKPSEAVLRWLSAQEPLITFTTTITQAEILYGVELLPVGKRKLRLSTALRQMFAEEFEDRILSFNGEAAETYAKIVTGRSFSGRPISQFDAMIAALHGLAGRRWQRGILLTSKVAGFKSSILGQSQTRE